MEKVKQTARLVPFLLLFSVRVKDLVGSSNGVKTNGEEILVGGR